MDRLAMQVRYALRSLAKRPLMSATVVATLALGIVSTDIRLTLALAVALAATSLAASYLPARRAASVDPIVALRAE